jgi:hypothetical protein
MKHALKSVFLCGALLVSGFAAARDIYVDQNNSAANDNNAGTAAAPLRTLTAGVAQASAGDVVIVKAGRYSDPNSTWYSAFTPARSGTATAPITIRSEPALAATLVPRDFQTGSRQSQMPALSIYRSQYIIIDGFKADGMMKIHHDVMGTAQHVTIQNSEIQYGSQQGDDPSLNWGLAIHVSNNNILRNNRIYNMRSSGNNSENTGAVMNFASAYNLIENNDADAGGGIVYSAFGQKAGNIHDNVWRRNIARNAIAGFEGKGGTGGDSFCDNETFYNNIIINTERAFSLNHNSRHWKVYNNTAYNVDYFLNQWQLNSVDNQFWNNLIVSASNGVYQIEDLTTSNFGPYISYSNYNFVMSSASQFARWSYGSSSLSLSQWRSTTGMDANTLTGDVLFVNAAGGNFKLQTGSPAKARGRNGEDIGAYATGSESIGVTRGPRPNPPVVAVN